MEMTSRQKDKAGLQRYGLHSDDVEVLKDAGIISRNSRTQGAGKLSVVIVSYLFTSDDNGETWTGPHIGKPDLDTVFKRFRIIPQKITPIRT